MLNKRKRGQKQKGDLADVGDVEVVGDVRHTAAGEGKRARRLETTACGRS